MQTVGNLKFENTDCTHIVNRIDKMSFKFGVTGQLARSKQREKRTNTENTSLFILHTRWYNYYLF